MNPTTTWADHELGLLRVVSGSLKSAADAHPEIQFPGSTRSSAAKRVAAAVVAYLKERTPMNDTTEDHNAKWERGARELATSLIVPVSSAIEREMFVAMRLTPYDEDSNEKGKAAILLAAKCALAAVLTGLLPRFREEAVVSASVDEWAYRTSMNYLNLIEIMAGVEMTRDV